MTHKAMCSTYNNVQDLFQTRLCNADNVTALLPCYYYWYSALGPVWAEIRAQSGNW